MANEVRPMIHFFIYIYQKLHSKISDIHHISLNDTYDYIIIILSTTGDGEQPDNAKLFYKKLRKYKERNCKSQ